ncbi:MAG: hypothetical protein ACWGMZ_02880 [Thermoguttaceae bacterium]
MLGIRNTFNLRRNTSLVGVCVLYVLWGGACAAQCAEGQKAPEFIRLRRDKADRPLALESAIVRYAPRDRRKDEPTVDLVTAIHIGEKSYYQRLNREFADYDAVLYELVAPEGVRIKKGEENSDSFVSMIQNALTELLDLQFQLKLIDYNATNMVHADMSPEQFAESMNKRGESVFLIFWRMMAAAMAQQHSNKDAPSDFQVLMALFDKDRAMSLKRILAEQFQSIEGMMNAVEGPSGSTLISERNKTALSVLRKELKAGKKKLAIFYGAGHMPDFDRRLRKEFDLVPINIRWLKAWDLRED